MKQSGISIIKYVREQANILGVKEIEIYATARILPVTIATWELGKTKPQRYSIFRLEQALQRKAMALGFKRKLNVDIFDC
jgi:hypothetical protein